MSTPRPELVTALESLFAYDAGAVSAGVHDETLRGRCYAELKTAAAGPGNREYFARLLRDMWLSETALANGYGVEDMLAFVDWLQGRMGIYLR